MKYNMSEIMKEAWKMVKALRFTMSQALKESWKAAKEALCKKLFSGKTSIGNFKFSRWEKAGMDRIYMNDNKNRSCGYINASTKEIVNPTGLYMYKEVMEDFLNMYAI